MISKKVNAREALAAIKAGLGDVALLEKFQLSSSGLQSLFDKLVDSGLITRAEIDDRSSLTQRTMALTVYRCPKCRMPQFEPFDICPQCGVIVDKFGEAPPTWSRQSGVPPQILGQPQTGAIRAHQRDLSFGERDDSVRDGRLSAPPQLRGVEFRLQTKSQFVTAPAFGQGILCCGGSDGVLSGFIVDTRMKKWAFRADGPIQSAPVIADGVVYCGTLAGTLYAVFLSNGSQKFAFASYSPIYGSPCVSGNLVYFGNYDGNLYSLGIESGTEFGRISLGKPIRTGPIVYKGRVYVACEDGSILVVT